LTLRRALVVLLARVLMAALGEALLAHPRWRPVATTAVVTLVVLVNGSFFVSARPLARDFDTPRPAWQKTAEDEAFDWIFSRTAAALQEHEHVMQTFVGPVRGLEAPEGTAVATGLWRPRST